MPPKQEIVASLYGAWRLMRLDPTGMTYFNLSADGFWRSFFAAVIIAPFYVVLSYIQFADKGEARAALVALDFVGYCVGWAAFPVAMLFIARFLQRADRYAGFIIAMNWIAVLHWVIVMVVFTLYQVLPRGPALLLYFGLVGGLLLYDFYVARVALGVGPGHAIAIAVIGFLMALLIDFTVLGFV